MKRSKFAVILLLVFALTLYSNHSASASIVYNPVCDPAGPFIGSIVWWTVQSCCKAYDAPEGKKWEAFKEGFAEEIEKMNLQSKTVGEATAY